MAKRRFNQDENMADIAAYAATPIEKPAEPVVANEVVEEQPSTLKRSSLAEGKSNPQPSTKLGRPKKTRKIEGGAPVTVFFDQETKSKLMLAKVAHKIEMKDLIAGATLLFLDKHYSNGQLSEAGQRELESALEKFYGE